MKRNTPTASTRSFTTKFGEKRKDTKESSDEIDDSEAVASLMSLSDCVLLKTIPTISQEQERMIEPHSEPHSFTSEVTENYDVTHNIFERINCPSFPNLKISNNSIEPDLLFNGKMRSFKRGSTHVAIAYFVFYYQLYLRMENFNKDTINLDPTYEARLLKMSSSPARGNLRPLKKPFIEKESNKCTHNVQDTTTTSRSHTAHNGAIKTNYGGNKIRKFRSSDTHHRTHILPPVGLPNVSLKRKSPHINVTKKSQTPVYHHYHTCKESPVTTSILLPEIDTVPILNTPILSNLSPSIMPQVSISRKELFDDISDTALFPKVTVRQEDIKLSTTVNPNLVTTQEIKTTPISSSQSQLPIDQKEHFRMLSGIEITASVSPPTSPLTTEKEEFRFVSRKPQQMFQYQFLTNSKQKQFSSYKPSSFTPIKRDEPKRRQPTTSYDFPPKLPPLSQLSQNLSMENSFLKEETSEFGNVMDIKIKNEPTREKGKSNVSLLVNDQMSEYSSLYFGENESS